MKISGLALTLLFGVYFTWYASHGQSTAQVQPVPAAFQGHILAASDADQVGGAYANGQLNRVAGVEDSLSLIVGNDHPRIISQVHVSNSVISWPSIVAWHPRLPYAYVAETRGIPTAAAQQVDDVFDDMPEGEKIFVVDYANSTNPTILSQQALGENIQGVSINQAGDLLVAGSTEKDKEIIVARLDEGRISQVFYFTHDEVQHDKAGAGFRTIEFHPEQNIIAANLDDEKLLFFAIAEEGEALTLNQVGTTLEVAKHWSVGNWHPSGQYFILTDVAWGNGSLGFLLNGKGRLVSVKFDPAGDHRMVSKVKVGLSPEGFDISPDGNYAVTVNLRRTWAPPRGFWFVPARKMASLSLIRINPENGELTKIGDDYGFKGALPEDAIFDQESNSIAVAVYHDWEDLYPKRGWIDFWELQDDQLLYTGQQVPVTRGVHNLLLINR